MPLEFITQRKPSFKPTQDCQLSANLPAGVFIIYLLIYFIYIIYFC